MIFGNARDLSSQVVAIPMTSFGMLMNSPDSEFQRIIPKHAQGNVDSPSLLVHEIPVATPAFRYQFRLDG
jgi:hypothetical protein